MTTKAIITDRSSILIVCVTVLIICFGAGYSYSIERAKERRHEVTMELFEYARYDAKNQRYEIVADVFGCFQ